jgi:NlpC/P60 family putative phage cell wall peptidase
MPVTRAVVVAEARTWVNTPFRHQGRIKGMACDCVGLILGAAADLGLVDRLGVPFLATDNANYSAQPLDKFVHEEAQRRLIEKPIEEMADGDIVTLRVPSIPCHVAICSTVNGVRYIVHAYASNEKVVENIMDEKWTKRIEGCFSFPGVE